ncbi:uncharacterized protein LOC101742950 isoform X2 [Bombyx mori]|uniref:Uncharacterized protein n=1 Tax=Bombyx mori TaxID=7091 RepID=A0A8R2M7H1_BOMMO|nr:uncharacterized protein LOC101742950 isoform X2 [Bombyx mori]
METGDENVGNTSTKDDKPDVSSIPEKGNEPSTADQEDTQEKIKSQSIDNKPVNENENHINSKWQCEATTDIDLQEEELLLRWDENDEISSVELMNIEDIDEEYNLEFSEIKDDDINKSTDQEVSLIKSKAGVHSPLVETGTGSTAEQKVFESYSSRESGDVTSNLSTGNTNPTKEENDSENLKNVQALKDQRNSSVIEYNEMASDVDNSNSETTTELLDCVTDISGSQIVRKIDETVAAVSEPVGDSRDNPDNISVNKSNQQHTEIMSKIVTNNENIKISANSQADSLIIGIEKESTDGPWTSTEESDLANIPETQEKTTKIVVNLGERQSDNSDMDITGNVSDLANSTKMVQVEDDLDKVRTTENIYELNKVSMAEDRSQIETKLEVISQTQTTETANSLRMITNNEKAEAIQKTDVIGDIDNFIIDSVSSEISNTANMVLSDVTDESDILANSKITIAEGTNDEINVPQSESVSDSSEIITTYDEILSSSLGKSQVKNNTNYTNIPFDASNDKSRETSDNSQIEIVEDNDLPATAEQSKLKESRYKACGINHVDEALSNESTDIKAVNNVVGISSTGTDHDKSIEQSSIVIYAENKELTLTDETNKITVTGFPNDIEMELCETEVSMGMSAQENLVKNENISNKSVVNSLQIPEDNQMKIIEANIAEGVVSDTAQHTHQVFQSEAKTDENTLISSENPKGDQYDSNVERANFTVSIPNEAQSPKNMTQDEIEIIADSNNTSNENVLEPTGVSSAMGENFSQKADLDLVVSSEISDKDDKIVPIVSEDQSEVITTAEVVNEDSEENVNASNDKLTSLGAHLTSLADVSTTLPIRANLEHGLNRPNAMLEIPTQELIDIDDAEDSSQAASDDGNLNNTINITQEINDRLEYRDTDNKVPLAETLTIDTTENSDNPMYTKTSGLTRNTEKAENRPDNDVSNENVTSDFKADFKNSDSENSKNTDDHMDVDMPLEINNAEPILTISKNLNPVGNVSEMNPNVDTISTRDLDINKTSLGAVKDVLISETVEPKPSTSRAAMEPAGSPELKELAPCTPMKQDEQSALEPKPSTSKVMVESVLSEATDSLGLLAESSRMDEDEEEPDDEDDGEDEDDFDNDESSNQMTAYNSEDSNHQNSDPDCGREQTESGDTTKDESEKDGVIATNLNTVESEEIEIQADSDENVSDEKCTQEAEGISQKNIEETVAAVQSINENKEVNDGSGYIETVKLSDTSDNELDGASKEIESGVDEASVARDKSSPSKLSMGKKKKLGISKARHVVNIVEVEESSSEDDIRPPESNEDPDQRSDVAPDEEGVTSVNIPKGIEVMCSGESTSELVAKEGEIVISRVPKPPPHKPARLNTSEVTIKTTSGCAESSLVIPETKLQEAKETDADLEVFNLDSDDEDGSAKESSKLESGRCLNPACPGREAAQLRADRAAVAHYSAKTSRNAFICRPCYEVVAVRTEGLVNGLKNFTPLFEMKMEKQSLNLVEISDSDSEDESSAPEQAKEVVGDEGAKLLEEHLANLINETWSKYKMDARMNEARSFVDLEVQKLEKQSKEIDQMLNECQVATDKLRDSLYKTFEPTKHDLPPICIVDIVGCYYEGTEQSLDEAKQRANKRKRTEPLCSQPKKAAIALGYAPLDGDHAQPDVTQEKTPIETAPNESKEDDREVSVVQLSAEVAPPDLPPPGELVRPPLKPGMVVWAMKNVFSPWVKVRIQDIAPKSTTSAYTTCTVKFDTKTKNPFRTLSARCLAHSEPPNARLTIGTRIIALFKNTTKSKMENYYSGVVAEIPNPVNNYRYLVFFDDGYAQYVAHPDTRVVCECSNLVWEEVHAFSREFVKQYLLSYPERPMVRLHAGQSLKTEWNGKWWISTILKVDASLAHVYFQKINRTEWIYRGSTRLAPLYLELQAAERQRTRPLPRSMAQSKVNMPYVEYTRSDEQTNEKQKETTDQPDDIRKQRAVAKKSTAQPQSAPPVEQQANLDSVISRVVYYTPKNAVKPLRMTSHTCGPKCKRTDVLALKDLRTYNPLAKPLLSGWERQIVRYKGVRDVMYRAPCGRRVRDIRELHAYLTATDSDMPVDLFDFHPATHCLAEFVINKCIVGKKDLSHGKENVPVPCVNYYDETLPEFCSYNTERTPTAGVPLNLDPDFLCGCDCTDDCQDKAKCACWQLTLEGARTIGLDGHNVGYDYKRLLEPLPSGIYECNSRCKCKQTCLNRVAQHPLQLKLQVFKTQNRGWGIRALNDVPKGSFLCVYAGNLLTDATANLDGLNEGDEYLAELDYIEVVEQMKEGYEEDISEADKKLGAQESGAKGASSDEHEESSSDDYDFEAASKDESEDCDFQPGCLGLPVTKFSKRLRQRAKKKQDEDKEKSSKEKEKEKERDKDKDKDKTKEPAPGEDCITISDDDEVREPSRFTAQAGMGANEFVPKHRSVRQLYGADEACYIMDAKVQGNIGRYLNHSCSPNVFVQNVFVDTHDPRFPWVAFFALCHVRAGTELTWNYNYDVGSVPGKVLYCHCGAPNCRGRLL